MKKHILPLLLALCLALSLLPAAALAASDELTIADDSSPVALDAAAPTADEAVAAVQALVDALPNAESVTDEDYDRVQAAYDAYEALTPEQQSAVTGAEAFEGLFVRFNNRTSIIPVGNDGDTSSHSHPICGISCSHSSSHNSVTWEAWDSDDSLPYNAGNYYLTKDVTLTGGCWYISKDISLCLNGHTITGANGVETIHVASNTFTLTNCRATGTITHASGDNGNDNTGVIVFGGTFNMYGGSITGNTAAGAIVKANSAFNMYGGSITGNTAYSYGGGVIVNTNGAFDMTGGSITGNTARYGSGVSSSGTFKLSGSPNISGNNTATGGVEGDVYLSNGKTITITGTLNNTTKIGVNSQSNGNTIEFLTDWDTYMSGKSVSDYFTNEKTGYTLSGGKLVKDTYGIGLNKSGTHSFPAATVGYSAQTPLTVTVTNTGNKPTGDLTVSLGGTNANAFILNDDETSNSLSTGGLNAASSAELTVAPRTGLAAGTYTATVTVTGSNNISAGFTVSFTVNPTPTYTISLSPTSLSFPEATVGYSAQSKLTFQITNTGNQYIDNLTVSLGGTNANAFILNGDETKNSLSTGGLNAASSAELTVEPRTGLAAGTYTATVTVTGEHGINTSLTVSFTVSNPNNNNNNNNTPKPDSAPSATPAPTAAPTAAPSATSAPSAKAESQSPKTGDEAIVALWLVLAAASTLGIAAVARKKKAR